MKRDVMERDKRIEWRLAATFLGGLIQGLRRLQDIAKIMADERPVSPP